MRKFKIILMSVICLIISAAFVTEVFASVLLNLSISGDIVYVSDEIGADIIGIYSKTGRDAVSETYLNISGPGKTDADGVYQMKGSEDSYVATTSSVETINVYSTSDIISFYIFVKNTGDRNIIPVIETKSKSTNINFNIEKYYFDISEEQSDAIALKRLPTDAETLIDTIDSLTLDIDYQVFPDNTSLFRQDVFMAKIIITVEDITNVIQYSNFELLVNFISDIEYSNSKILSVRQENNILATAWEKIGKNARLNASSIKAETNDLGLLYSAYNGRNTNADLSMINSNLTYECDDYDDQPVYKDIDIINVDIETGEIIGKLSDTLYPFEWFGGDVTLEAGTTLASGRTLTEEETFTVDVYTYYPTFYARRWNVLATNQSGNIKTFTYISISDEPFAGSVEIPECYIATCEANMFNPDKTIAHNSNGIYLRSYVCGWTPLTKDSANYLVNNYGFTTYDGITDSTTQSQILNWQNNLTIAWINYANANPTLKTAYKYMNGSSGENYHAFTYQLLYLVKYANINSQETVGYGNVFTKALYESTGSVKNTTQAYNQAPEKTISIRSNIETRFESEKGSGTIGLYGTSGQSTGTTTFNSAKMAYGYNNLDVELYTVDFLTYNNGEKRILRDGYVGSDKYTAVCCLGKINPWGNVGTWVFGMAVTVVSGGNIWAYAQFSDYDTTNYYLDNSPTTQANLVDNLGYAKLSYSLQTTKGIFRYLGTSTLTTASNTINGLLTTIGLPPKDSSAGTSSSGLCDYYWVSTNTGSCYGVMTGGTTNNKTDAGLFYFTVDTALTGIREDYGVRTMLI